MAGWEGYGALRLTAQVDRDALGRMVGGGRERGSL